MARAKKPNFQPFEAISGNSRYFRITNSMMKSKAWAELDPYDIVAYLYFRAKYYVKRDLTDNSRNISLTYAEMQPLMSWGRFKKSIDKLIEVGFLDMVMHKPQTRTATIYGLSKRWHLYGTSEFRKQERVIFRRGCKRENGK